MVRVSHYQFCQPIVEGMHGVASLLRHLVYPSAGHSVPILAGSPIVDVLREAWKGIESWSVWLLSWWSEACEVEREITCLFGLKLFIILRLRDRVEIEVEGVWT